MTEIIIRQVVLVFTGRDNPNDVDDERMGESAVGNERDRRCIATPGDASFTDALITCNDGSAVEK